MRRYLGGPVPAPQLQPRFASYLQGHPDVGLWIARIAGTQSPAGLIELSPHKEGAGYEISYQFHPDFWGQGYAREALTRIIVHAFENLCLKHLFAETQGANSRSCHLLESLGFIRKSTFIRYGEQQVLYTMNHA